MADIPEHDLEESRAALAPTLDATAAILPWVQAPPCPLRPRLNERWIAAGKRLYQPGPTPRRQRGRNRPAIFKLYAVALDTADSDCLRLGEALASAADRLEDNGPSPADCRTDGKH
jgi:hypothetical protein